MWDVNAAFARALTGPTPSQAHLTLGLIAEAKAAGSTPSDAQDR